MAIPAFASVGAGVQASIGSCTSNSWVDPINQQQYPSELLNGD